MRGCEACGEISPARARFCLACGQPLGDEPKTVPGLRRNISVIFADLVGSTTLGESLDAEALRYVTGRYFEAVRLAAERGRLRSRYWRSPLYRPPRVCHPLLDRAADRPPQNCGSGAPMATAPGPEESAAVRDA